MFFFCKLYNEVTFKSDHEQTIMSINELEGGIYNVLCHVFGILVSWFFKRALRKETSLNSINYLNKFSFIRNY